MVSTLIIEASVSPDGKLVVFIAFARERAVQCSITREVLEQYFWAPIGASDARLLKAYMDGQKRIAAAVERKMLKAPHEPVRLGAADFSR
ncbi:DUF1488 family protein [Paraburkholderia lacunae]|uniref:DUF1488 domain-containing protein n=1 Tax=Paraburkholderia lacunae TaxID=2211104 RepID=A0A370N790_9BURK|nr:DUF1488 family protein [Paraburkholderia lacunae]RDK01474.1 hypothetical protein DLM46_16760 [Paraburkholderia lacunae]